MKQSFIALILVSILSLACGLATLPGVMETPTNPPSLPMEEPSPANAQSAPGRKETSPCGDGVCNGPENARNCPQDCDGVATATPSENPGIPLSAPSLELAGAEDTYWVTNPTSGARLYVQVFYPNNWNGSDSLPALILMPGGIGESDPQKAGRIANQGFLVVIFDADGRGQSEGTENYNGFITQDGLAAVINAAAQLPGLNGERYGLVSYSFGVTAATGALARHPDLPIKY